MPTVANRHRYLPVDGWGPARALTGRERRPVMPDDAIYAGRGSPLGNPYRHEQHGDDALPLYRRWLFERLRRCDPAVMRAMASIGHATLVVCSCAPKPCHADVVVSAWTWLQSQPFFSEWSSPIREAQIGEDDVVDGWGY